MIYKEEVEVIILILLFFPQIFNQEKLQVKCQIFFMGTDLKQANLETFAEKQSYQIIFVSINGKRTLSKYH